MAERLEEVVMPLRRADFGLIREKAGMIGEADETGYIIKVVLEGLIEYFEGHKAGEGGEGKAKIKIKKKEKGKKRKKG